ncbi:MAG TPA: hypothetical protein VGK41_01115 [Solirubrobacterales bacterium]
MSFPAIFNGGCIEVRSGPQPANANMAPTGTLLARITQGGGAWDYGSDTNGLQFSIAGPRITKDPLQSWRLNGLATGVAGWFRLLTKDDPLDESTTALRIDGTIGPADYSPGDYQMRLTDLNLTASSDIDIPLWWFYFPPIE